MLRGCIKSVRKKSDDVCVGLIVKTVKSEILIT